MPNPRFLSACLALCFCGVVPVLYAQGNQPDPLTDAQQQAIAAAGIYPAKRIELYVKYLNDRADTIKSLIPRREAARDRRMDDELQAFSSLVDELASNLDQYGGRKADLRPALKRLNKAIPRWQALLHSLPGDPAYQISRDLAAGSVSDLADQAKALTAAQFQYFKTHKKAKGQQWQVPD